MMPNMTDAISGFASQAQFAVIGKAADNFEVLETKVDIQWFTGVFEPIPPRRLRIKPEGQRTWKWWTLWTRQALDLDAVVKDAEGRELRVMQDSDWKRAGYFSYELAEMPKCQK